MGPAVVSWSSGKDGCWALEVSRAAGHEVVGLLTTVTEADDAVTHHGVPHRAVMAQARSLGVPLHTVRIPADDGSGYAERMGAAVAGLVGSGVTDVVFGDLFLADLRAHREARLAGSGLTPRFPLWERPTGELAREMLDGGVRATIVSVDLRHLPAEVVGAPWDEAFLAALPAGVDPCGEHGEFHTFVHDAPSFSHPVELELQRVIVTGDHAHARIV